MADLDGESMVTGQCLHELLDFFIKNSYRAKTTDRRYEIIHKRCIHMVSRDYKIEIIDNRLGQLCSHYPSELIVMERELDSKERDSTKECVVVNDTARLRELIPSARFARCRSRFIMPVILFNNKNICRSATLSSMAELYGRTGFDWILTLPTVGIDLEDKGQSSADTPSNNSTPATAAATAGGQGDKTASESDWVLLNKVRGQDVQLLKALGIRLICDLMVEKKKLKYGLYVCSSEKVDKWARYADFHIASMPYPGCEFFKDYKDNGYNAVSLKFDWKQGFVDAELNVPVELEGAIEGPYKDYQDWDLVEMTRNYLKMLLQYLVQGDSGVLVHCISGWDRTPLYISLLRLSLWADGEVHRSLCPAEMLYFTLAFDWLIYGHQFKERHDKGEEVLYFCFDFLKYMLTDDFSVHNQQHPQHSNHRSVPVATVATPTPCVGGGMAIPLPGRPKGGRPKGGSVGAAESLLGEASGGRAKMEGFDTNPPLSSSYELGESWVSVTSNGVHHHTYTHTSSPSSSSSSSSSSNTRQLQNNSSIADTEHGMPSLSLECQCHSPTGSVSHVSLDCLNQRCQYHTQHHNQCKQQRSLPISPSHCSLRAQRLNKVRQLFIKSFRNSIPEVPNSSSGSSSSSGGSGSGDALAGLTGFISRLAGSVRNTSSTSV